MHLSPILCALAATALASGAATRTSKRQGQTITILSPGSISAPKDGAQLTADTPFALGIPVPVPEWNHCNPLYTPVEMYLLAEKPTTSSLNATYRFSDYLFYFGRYVVTNDNPAPPSPTGSPPPSTLTMPDIGASYDGEELYVASIEIIGGCPPTGYTEYAIDSVNIVYRE